MRQKGLLHWSLFSRATSYSPLSCETRQQMNPVPSSKRNTIEISNPQACLLLKTLPGFALFWFESLVPKLDDGRKQTFFFLYNVSSYAFLPQLVAQDLCNWHSFQRETSSSVPCLTPSNSPFCQSHSSLATQLEYEEFQRCKTPHLFIFQLATIIKVPDMIQRKWEMSSGDYLGLK